MLTCSLLSGLVTSPGLRAAPRPRQRLSVLATATTDSSELFPAPPTDVEFPQEVGTLDQAQRAASFGLQAGPIVASYLGTYRCSRFLAPSLALSRISRRVLIPFHSPPPLLGTHSKLQFRERVLGECLSDDACSVLVRALASIPPPPLGDDSPPCFPARAQRVRLLLTQRCPPTGLHAQGHRPQHRAEQGGREP